MHIVLGTGYKNERGERLLDFAEENDLVVTNSLFQKVANRYWTWEAPGGMTNNQIDFILSSDRKIVGKNPTKSKHNTKRQGRVCRTQQISEKET